jgi:hypothetical protein
MEIESELGKTRIQGQQRQVLNVDDRSDIYDQMAPQIPENIQPVTQPQGRWDGPEYQKIPPVRMSASSGQSQQTVPSISQRYDQAAGNMPQPVRGMGVVEMAQSMGRQSEDTIEELKQFDQQRNAPQVRKQLSPEIKRRVEFLTGLGRLTDEFEFEGSVFVIQTLKSGELKEVAKIILNQNNIDATFEIRSQILVRAIRSIDNYSLEQILGTNSLEDKLALIDEFDENAVTFIYSKYQEMVDRGNEKYGFNTKQDVEEVVEEIKKP